MFLSERITRKAASLFLCTVATVAQSQTAYCDKVDGETIVQKTRLTISYSCARKLANYVGYYITAADLQGSGARESAFYTDPQLPATCQALSSDYNSSGYDRGHLSPAADWKADARLMHDSFSMANICPQRPQLNRHWWLDAEKAERTVCLSADTAYIISGTLCGNNGTLCANGGTIPQRLYKVIVGVKSGAVVACIALIYENTDAQQPIDSRRTTVAEIETIIGQDLFCGFWFDGKL